MSKPKLAHTNAGSIKRSSDILDEAKAKQPTQVVVWYEVAGGETGVLFSGGPSRVKTVGALHCAAYNVWEAE